ncbi:MAG: GGDEF domain-containing protein [Hyphomonadaceae bacterium]
MLGGKGPKKAQPSDPLEARFGLKRRALKPALAAAFDALMAENAELARRLTDAENFADHDTLTPCMNRRAFMRALHQAMSFAERYKTPGAVCFIDLDGFKAVNDQFGHAAGDAVLVHVARVLRAQVRESDSVGRLGGDEFGIILVHAGLEEARRKAAAIEEALRATPAEFAGVSHRVGASIGVHGFTSVEDVEIALARADEAMYAEKHARKRAGANAG